MNTLHIAHPLIGTALEATETLCCGPLRSDPGYPSAVAEEARSHDDVIDQAELAPITNERLTELIEWSESYRAREGSPRADTTLALRELQQLRSELDQATRCATLLRSL